MKKTRLLLSTVLLTGSLLTIPASAASLSHTVAAGDTMWKLAVRYQVGTSEIIGANPQVSNPDLIYPGQVLQIPQLVERALDAHPIRELPTLEDILDLDAQVRRWTQRAIKEAGL